MASHEPTTASPPLPPGPPGRPAQRRAPGPVPLGSGPLTFPPSTPTRTVTLSPDTKEILDDDGAFTPALSFPSNATAGSPWSVSGSSTEGE